MKHHESPASEPQPGRLQQITRVARNNIGMLAIGTAVVGGAAYNIQKAKQLEVIEIGGVHFKLSEDWEKVYEVTGLDEGQVKEAIEGHMNKLGDFIDPPVGSTVTVTPSSDINDVVVSIRYDKEVWEEKRRFIAKEVYSGEEIHLNPNHLNESTTYHELVHMARVGSGTFVMNNSFEEGLAEYGEMRAYPTKGEKPEIYTFIDHFPQLRELSVDDPKLGSRILN
ncbi:MAG: hypothetical protein OEY44_02410, partial [Candidatus Peregrinibacteria bacterium]|nr:hypothetical protein [Candidatus Peregrinibacteria bacterium]